MLPTCYVHVYTFFTPSHACYSCSLTCYKDHAKELCANRVEYRSITEMVQSTPNATAPTMNPALGKSSDICTTA